MFSDDLFKVFVSFSNLGLLVLERDKLARIFKYLVIKTTVSIMGRVVNILTVKWSDILPFLLSFSSGYLNDASIPILSLNDAGLILGGYATLPFRYKPVNDGNWHYVIVTWEKSTGHVDLILDFVRSGQVDGYAQGARLSGGG